MSVRNAVASAITSSMMLQADSGIRASPPSQGNQKFDFGAFLKGDLPKKLLIMLVGTEGCFCMLPFMG